MLVTKSLIPLPSRKIIVDLALRNGLPDKEAVCPYKGRANYFNKYTIGDPRYSHLPAIKFFELQADFDANKIKPDHGPYTKRQPGEKDALDNYLIRLEDIDESWVIKYFENKVYGLKINNDNSLKLALMEIEDVRSWMDESDSDIMYTEKDMQVRDVGYSASELLKWEEKLPYLLKRLHEVSKSREIGIISLLIAYEKTRRDREYNKGTARNPKPTETINAGVYKMTRDGRLSVPPRENKGDKWNYMWKWIQGYEEYRDDYFYDAMEFLDILERLDIDIKNEDPFNYQEEFISKLEITYVPKNKNLMLRGRRVLNQRSVMEIKRMPLENYGKEVERIEFTNRLLDIENLVQQFLDYGNESYINKSRNKIDDIIRFMAMYNYKMGTDIQLSRKTVKEGIYMDSARIPFLFDVRVILTNKELPVADALIYKAFLHTSGYLILDVKTLGFYYLDIETALDYLQDNLSSNDLSARYGNNQKYGTWKGPLI